MVCTESGIHQANSSILVEDRERVSAPWFEKIPSFSSLPMVDHVTVYSNGSDASYCDISSVSSDEEEDGDENDQCFHTPTKPLSSPRSIFGRYWEKNAGAVVDPFETLKMISLAAAEEEDATSCNTYERTLQRTPPSLFPRRHIFPNASFDHMDQVSPPRADLSSSRKTYSDSRLRKDQKIASCLRCSRFSRRGSVESSSGSEHSSVSFSPKVDVIVFRHPVEHWAAKGWSEYFF
jgi:hypothetical protein